MDIYKLYRLMWDFAFENPERLKPNDIAIYSFAIEHCNRLGWKQKFGFPTAMAMEAVGIRSYSVYKKHLDNLVDIGFLEMVESSKNQHSANIVALQYYNKATNKALDKAIVKHDKKQPKSTRQSTSSIDKPNYNETNIPEERETINSATLFENEAEEEETLPPYLPPRENPKSEYGDLMATDVLLNCDVSKCLDNYFHSNYYAATREQAAIPFGMDNEIFKDWAEAFNTYQISIGNTKKTLKDWAVHFPRWLHKQDISKNPKTLQEYEQRTDKKSYSGTGKAATGANVDTDSAIEKLSRMS